MPSENAKRVKKEEVQEDGEEMSIDSLFQNRKKKSNNATTSNGARVKKEEPKLKEEENNDNFDEPIGKKSLNKVKKEQSKVKKEEYVEPTATKSSNRTDKKKKIKEEEKKSWGEIAEQNGKNREKKVYDLPGQKRDPPEERDPLRIFYESLYQQEPNSEMAAFWMMESGLLPKEESKKVYEKKLKRNQQQKLGSPMKAVVNVKKSAESATVQRKIISSAKSKKTPESNGYTRPSKKRKIDDNLSDNGSDDDFVMALRSVKKQRGA